MVAVCPAGCEVLRRTKDRDPRIRGIRLLRCRGGFTDCEKLQIFIQLQVFFTSVQRTQRWDRKDVTSACL